ncbi:hypothetical protein ACOMHN_044481 [Nucella lapillus]
MFKTITASMSSPEIWQLMVTLALVRLLTPRVRTTGRGEMVIVLLASLPGVGSGDRWMIKIDINKLERVQRRAAMYATNTYMEQAPGTVTTLLQDLRWDTLENRRSSTRLQMLYKINNKLVDLNKSHFYRQWDGKTRGNRIYQERVNHPAHFNSFSPLYVSAQWPSTGPYSGDFSTREDFSEEEFKLRCPMPPRDPQQPPQGDITITTAGVEKLLKNLDPSKAGGPDELSPRVLKEVAVEIAPSLALLYQASLDTGVVPVDWKSAHVSPVFKNGERYKPENYRPISLTSIPCKLLEHILVRDIMTYCENHQIFCEEQHGFRRGRSCETQLLGLVDEVSRALENGLQEDLLVLDFSKAFDKVSHSLLVTLWHRRENQRLDPGFPDRQETVCRCQRVQVRVRPSRVRRPPGLSARPRLFPAVYQRPSNRTDLYRQTIC